MLEHACRVAHGNVRGLMHQAQAWMKALALGGLIPRLNVQVVVTCRVPAIRWGHGWQQVWSDLHDTKRTTANNLSNHIAGRSYCNRLHSWSCCGVHNDTQGFDTLLLLADRDGLAVCSRMSKRIQGLTWDDPLVWSQIQQVDQRHVKAGALQLRRARKPIRPPR